MVDCVGPILKALGSETAKGTNGFHFANIEYDVDSRLMEKGEDDVRWFDDYEHPISIKLHSYTNFKILFNV